MWFENNDVAICQKLYIYIYIYIHIDGEQVWLENIPPILLSRVTLAIAQ